MLDLKLKICPSEIDFFNKYDIEKAKVSDLRVQLLEKCNNKCQGCNISKEESKLNLHLEEEDLKNPLKSRFVILCNACHVTQHIDKAIELGWVQLVNSKFTQRDLVIICRAKNGTLATAIKNRDIVILKKDPALFIEELKAGTLGKNSIKIVFSPKNYKWD